MMRTVYIMRGVSGSGKSTRAREIAGRIGVIHSTDDFFYVNGKYRFDPTRLSEYHDLNFRAFCGSLDKNVPVVVCDNTNARCWQYARYVEVAKRMGYLVRFVVLPHPMADEAARRTVHGVPVAVIQRMIDDWEDDAA